jgi:hypothetical protein
MATTLFTAFLPEVAPFVMDCPQVIVINAIRNAAIEFCERTLIWQANIAAMDLAAGTAEYTVATPADTQLVEIMACYYNQVLLVPKDQDGLVRIFRLGDWRSVEGPPRYFTRPSSSVLQVVPTPVDAETGAVGVRAALAPTRTATGIDSEVYDDYLMAIAAGARAYLHSMTGQTFYDPNLSMQLRREFMAAIGHAKIKVNKGQTRSAPRIEFQHF